VKCQARKVRGLSVLALTMLWSEPARSWMETSNSTSTKARGRRFTVVSRIQTASRSDSEAIGGRAGPNRPTRRHRTTFG
jgi:hypothetical protein